MGMFLAGCGWQGSPCAPDGVEGARMSLLATDLEMSRIAREQGMEAAFALHLTDDAVFLPMNFPTLYGPEDITTFFAGAAGLSMSWTPADAEIAQSCEIGYVFGAWTVTGADADGNTLDARGKYLGVWRRLEGQWRLSVYMQNMDPEVLSD
jgi:ketosteroid isomerase-like protein